jgi:molybdopterin biosynthesis enzyme
MTVAVLTFISLPAFDNAAFDGFASTAFWANHYYAPDMVYLYL